MVLKRHGHFKDRQRFIKHSVIKFGILDVHDFRTFRVFPDTLNVVKLIR